MGTPGLHPKLAQAKHAGHLSDYQGKVALVDTLIWICQHLYGSNLQYAGAGAIQSCIADVLKKINLLLEAGIKPIMVFDGRKLPGKAKAHKERKEKRDKMRKQIEQKKSNDGMDSNLLKDMLMEVEDIDQSTSATSNSPQQHQLSKLTEEEVLVLLMDALQIDEQVEEARNSAQLGSDIAHELIVVLREAGIDYIVAPYEADSQIAFMAREGYGDIVLSEDGDLVTHGCQEVLFKMQRNGLIKEIYKRSQLHFCPGFPEGYDQTRMIWRAILGDCDYLQSLPGIKIGKALKIVNQTPSNFSSTEMLRSIPAILNKPQMNIPNEYYEDFCLAEFTFRHPLVFDPLLKKLVPLNPLSPHCQPSEKELTAAGPQFPDSEAYDLAVGNISPAQPDFKRYEKYDFDESTTYPDNSLWRNGFKKTLRPKLDNNQPLQRKTPKCPICGRIFSYTAQLVRHLRQHNGKKKFECALCNRQFHWKSHLESHVLCHTGERPFSCIQCFKTFARREHLKNHKLIHFGKNQVCEHCGKRFFLPDVLKTHIRTHTGEKPYSCAICGKSFASWSSFKDHKKTHTGERPFACPFCNKRFQTSSYLKIHIRVHTGKRPYICQDCGKTFARKGNLNLHMVTHSEERPFVCKHCNSAFKTITTIKEHITTHAAQTKPYNCLQCGKSFTRKRSLKQHTLTHSGEKPFSCKLCEKSFTAAKSLKMHMMNHSGEIPYGCDKCPKKFKTKSQLTVHKRSHSGERPYICDNCGSGFTTSGNLHRHRRRKHN